MTDVTSVAASALRGVTFSKQFPSPAEPLRGLFVAEQVLATRNAVDWRVIAPVPFVPRVLAGVLRKPYVRGDDDLDGIPVARPRYPVLPRRALYTTVAPAMARSARGAWREILASHRPDFIHSHALYPSGAAARRLAGGAVPYVVSIHGSDLYTNMVRPSWAAEVRATLTGASVVVCVSASLARDAVALGGADPARTVVIPDTFDSARFRYVKRPAHSGSLRLVTVGRLVEVKGFDILVRALGDAVRDGLDATLTIVGAGQERTRLETLVAENDLAARVAFAGALGEDALLGKLAEADVFVSASRKEGFGVAIVEALATGLPVIATRSGGPDDIVTEDDGLLVAPEDVSALSGALSGFAVRAARYDQEAIATRALERYGPEHVGAMLVDVYRSVTAGEPLSTNMEATR